MLYGYDTYAGCFFIGLSLALSITPLVRKLALAVGAIDAPGNRKIHRQATPLLGGLAIFVGTWTPLGLLYFWQNRITTAVADSIYLFIAIFIAGAIMLLVGIYDDKRGMNATKKLSFQIPIAVALVYCGIGFKTLNLPYLGAIELGIAGPVLSILWIVGITNALNLIDGINGLATGTALLVCATNALIAMSNENYVLALIMFSMAGACLGFLRYNFGNATIFLGDTGSLFIGVTLAATSIAANAKSSIATSMIIPALVLGYPIFDTLLSMARRKLRGRSMFSADREHLHHKLLAKGLNHSQAALILYGLSLIFCLLAVGTAWQRGALIWISAIGLGVALVMGLRFLGFGKYLTAKALRIERPVFKIAYHVAQIAKLKFSLATSLEEAIGLIRTTCEQFGMQHLEIMLQGKSGGSIRNFTLPLGRRDKFVQKLQDSSFPNGQDYAIESFVFADTGLQIKVYYIPEQFPQDLLVEYRIRLGEVMQQANDCIRRLGTSRKDTSNNIPAPKNIPENEPVSAML